MDGITEHFFLDELQYLCASAIVHGEALKSAASTWLDADTKMTTIRSQRPSAGLGYSQHQEYGRLTNERIAAQNQIYRELESFVGVQGRIIDILRPGNSKSTDVREQRRSDRASQLLTLLGIASGAVFLDKVLRNKWTHFDELLDDSCSVDPEGVNPQRVCKRAAAAADTRTLRLLVIDDQSVRILGHGEYDLKALCAGAHELEAKVKHAIQTWGTRW